ncbi:DUF4188 domain-containing protein [Caulobacter sp. KR2-114]|jgi:hypothetical protein|uniref:DUF4188 domain-containing protein n=1 Tax=Caulobacter sp. KR2-114 TaxID=3400912 RepID=UPI003BFF723F
MAEKIINKRVCAEIDGEFVVFLLGTKFVKPWKFWKWGLVAKSMKRMLEELAEHPEFGMLHSESYGQPFGKNVTVQYWRTFEHLEAYARNTDNEHAPAWKAFFKIVGLDGDVGIWHETYAIAPGRYESIYGSMPPMGLGKAGRIVDAVGARQDARQRMKATAAA